MTIKGTAGVNKSGAKPTDGGGKKNRTLWIVLILLLILLLCVCAFLFLAWTYGDTVVNILRSSIQP